MTKVVYNACYGGFSVSDAGLRRYAELKGVTLYPEKLGESGGLTTYWTIPPEEREGKMLEGDAWYKADQAARIASNQFHSDHTLDIRGFKRTDPVLVQVVEELGDAANGMCAQLAIAEVEPGTQYRIDEYDGYESVATRESYDWETA